MSQNVSLYTAIDDDPLQSTNQNVNLRPLLEAIWASCVMNNLTVESVNFLKFCTVQQH